MVIDSSMNGGNGSILSSELHLSTRLRDSMDGWDGGDRLE